MNLHAGLIARREAGRWRGVLITGPSGAGKSDLALRCLGYGFRLVADDRTLVWASGGRLYGRAPQTLEGLIEARGVGIVAAAPLALAQVALIVDCVASGEVERLPDGERQVLAGVAIPRIRLPALEASAPSKLSCGFMHLGLRD